MSVRPCKSSTLSVMPSSHTFSRIRARVGGGGRCTRDGAPSSAAFLKLRSVCLRRINQLTSSEKCDGQSFRLQGILYAAAFRSVFALPSTPHNVVQDLLSLASLHSTQWQTIEIPTQDHICYDNCCNGIDYVCQFLFCRVGVKQDCNI